MAAGRRIPILITAGGLDKALPPEPAIEVYRALKRLGYPTKVVVYPEDNHQIETMSARIVCVRSSIVIARRRG